jgi:hypothetical protein
MERLKSNYSRILVVALIPFYLIGTLSSYLFEYYFSYIVVNTFTWTVVVAIIGYQLCLRGKKQKALCDIASYCAFLYTIFIVIISIDSSSNSLIKLTNFKMGALPQTFRDSYFALMPYAMALCFGLGFAKRLHDYNTAS